MTIDTLTLINNNLENLVKDVKVLGDKVDANTARNQELGSKLEAHEKDCGNYREQVVTGMDQIHESIKRQNKTKWLGYAFGFAAILLVAIGFGVVDIDNAAKLWKLIF